MAPAARAGSQVAFTKVESAQALFEVRAAGATLAQGYHLDAPGAVPASRLAGEAPA